MDALNTVILGVMDVVAGWSLRLPWDITLLVVAVGSAAILIGVRLFTTNQDLLRRCAADKKQLKKLIREAKQRGDGEALRRLRAVKSAVGMKIFRAEGRPLLAALLPIALLGTWAFQRLEFHPPQAGEPVEVALYFPPTAAGEIVHLAPEEKIQAEGGWVREIAAVADDGPPHGLAAWKLNVEPGAYTLKFRYGQATYEHKLRAGRTTYEAPTTFYGDERVLVAETRMREAKLLGRVPGIRAIALPPWLVAYLLIVIAISPLVKRVAGIY